MAQNIGEAQINLSVNTSQMEREVSAALKRLETKGFNLGGGINAKAFTQPLGRITGAANEFQKSLDASNARVIAFGASAGAIYAVQRAFEATIRTVIDVEKSLADINVILNVSQKILTNFGNSFFDIAKNTGLSFSEVAKAATEVKSTQSMTVSPPSPKNPINDLAAIITNDVPTASFIGSLDKRTKAGIIKKPPPAPTKPVTTPTTAPSNKITG